MSVYERIKQVIIATLSKKARGMSNKPLTLNIKTKFISIGKSSIKYNFF